jgi:hypothetical protein
MATLRAWVVAACLVFSLQSVRAEPAEPVAEARDGEPIPDGAVERDNKGGGEHAAALEAVR